MRRAVCGCHAPACSSGAAAARGSGRRALLRANAAAPQPVPHEMLLRGAADTARSERSIVSVTWRVQEGEAKGRGSGRGANSAATDRGAAFAGV